MYANAAPTAGGNEAEAEIMRVRGGAESIISMTYDDGDMTTALWLNEKFEQYICMSIDSGDDTPTG